MQKSIVQMLRKIGKLNFVKVGFKKYSVIKLNTAHIFSICSFFIQSLVFEVKIINKKISSTKDNIFLNVNCDNLSKY